MSNGRKLETVGTWLLLAQLFALPLSIVAAEPLAFAAVAVWVVALWRRGNLREALAVPFAGPLLLFVMLGWLSTLWSIRPQESIDKWHHFLLLMLAMVFPLAFGSDRKRDGWWMAGAFIAGCTLLAVYDMVRVPVEVARGAPLFSTGNMRDPQFYLVSLLLLAGVLAARQWPRARGWLFVAMGLNILGLVVHFKRGVWFSAVAAFMLFAFAAGKRRWVLVLAGVVSVLLFLPDVRARLSLLQDATRPELGGRYVLWTEVAPQLMRTYPQGMGWHAMTHADLASRAAYVQPKLTHLHNNLLQVAAELGWPGLALWLMLVGTVCVVFWKGFRAAALAGRPEAGLALAGGAAFVGLMLNGLVESNFLDTEGLMTFAFLMGLSAVLWPGGERGHNT